MKKETDYLIFGIFLGLVILGCIWIIYANWDAGVQEAEQQLNQTITNASINSYWKGVYDVAYQQTQTGNVYFLNATNGLNFMSLQELCGK